MVKTKKESEFGCGLSYCLGLFLAHAERPHYDTGVKINDAELWFNGASDHLYELQVPEFLSMKLHARLKLFQDKVLRWGHGYEPEFRATEEDKNWAIEEAKNLLLEIDKFFKIPIIKASYN